MKVLHTEKEYLFYQTHLSNGHIWLRVDGMDIPLSKQYDEDGSAYSYLYKNDFEVRIYQVTDEEEYNNLPNL